MRMAFVVSFVFDPKLHTSQKPKKSNQKIHEMVDIDILHERAANYTENNNNNKKEGKLVI